MPEELCQFTDSDINFLNKLGIDFINSSRNYWFVRTKGGLYFDDFYFENYIGIEWDDIIDTNISSVDDLTKMVIEKYPDENKSTHVANQIYKFIHEFKKGDIVIIPNKNSKILVFGEILEDDIYIHDQANVSPIEYMFMSDEEVESLVPILRKRRKIKWLKSIDRDALDPYLQTFIYAHNTIVDLNPYSDYIDRTLTTFYIKGDDAYFTYRVNKASNILFDDLANLFIFNKEIIRFINKYCEDFLINYGDLICKINVQSKGPVQLKGTIKKMLVFGLISMTICGGSVKLNIKDGIEISNGGLVAVVNTAMTALDIIWSHQDNTDYTELLEKYKECQEELDLITPEVRHSLNN